MENNQKSEVKFDWQKQTICAIIDPLDLAHIERIFEGRDIFCRYTMLFSFDDMLAAFANR